MDAPLLIQLPKETFCMKTRYMIIRKYAKIYKKARAIDRLLKSYRERIKFERRKRRNPFSSNLKK